MCRRLRISTTLVFACSLLALGDNAMAQGVLDGGRADPTQLQRNRELIELNPIEKPKPEYEIIIPPDQGSPAEGNLQGVTVVPDQPLPKDPADVPTQDDSKQKTP